MGMPGNSERLEFRVIDIYRREGDKLIENWIFIDFLHVMHQQGLDVLGRMQGLKDDEAYRFTSSPLGLKAVHYPCDGVWETAVFGDPTPISVITCWRSIVQFRKTMDLRHRSIFRLGQRMDWPKHAGWIRWHMPTQIGRWSKLHFVI